MLNDAIRMIAAAICSEEKQTTVQVTPCAALGYVAELLLQLTAYAEISAMGEAHIRTILRTPDLSAPRFGALPRELFFLYAGMIAEMNLTMRVNAVDGGVSADELDALSDAAGNALVYAKTKNGIFLSGFTAGEGLCPGVNVPAAFAAGLLLGACYCERDTLFHMQAYADAPAVQTAIGAINDYAGSAEGSNGDVTVRTLRGRFDPDAGGRRKKKKQRCS